MANKTVLQLDTLSGIENVDLMPVYDYSETNLEKLKHISFGDFKTTLSGAFSGTGHGHTEADISDLDKYTQAEVESLIAAASGTTDHSDLDNLDYASSGHTGFQPAGSYATENYVDTAISEIDISVDLATLSGALQADIDTKADDSAFTSHTGDSSIHFTEASIDKYTQSEVNTLLNNKYDKTGGTIDGNVVVTGDLVVSGTQFIVETEEILIEDHMLTLNYGEVGAGVSFPTAGIEIDRGSETNYLFVFDETDDNFQVGISGSLQAVATREDAPTDTYVPYWNAAQYRFDTSGSMAYSDIASISHVNTVSGVLQTELTSHTDDSSVHFTKTSVSGIYAGDSYISLTDVSSPTTSGTAQFVIDGTEVLSLTENEQTFGQDTSSYININQTGGNIVIRDGNVDVFELTDTSQRFGKESSAGKLITTDTSAELYYAGDKKLETSVSGVLVTTGLFVDGTSVSLEGHSHTESDISDLDKYTQAEVDSLIASASGTTDHSELNNLDYASSGHTGFQPAGDYATTAELASTSGVLQSDIDGKADTVHSHTESDITDLGDYSTTAELTATSGVLQTNIDGKSDLGHTHDGRYYTETEVDTISGSLQSNIDAIDVTGSGTVWYDGSSVPAGSLGEVGDYYLVTPASGIYKKLPIDGDCISDSGDVTAEGYAIGQENPSYMGGAFDGVTNDPNATGSWYAYNGTYVPTGWTGIDFGAGNEKTIYKYSIYREDNDSAPKSWTFEASVSGTWSGEEVILDTVSNYSFNVAAEWHDFTFTNDTAYRYYRLNVSANNGNATYVTIREMQWFECNEYQVGGWNEVWSPPDISGKSDVGHTHDDRYYTESEVNTISGVLQTNIDGKSDLGHDHDSDYAALVHDHTESDITDLDKYTQAEVDALISETRYTPYQLTVNTGTLIAGTVSGVQTLNDDSVIEVDEVTGVPGFDIEVTFSGVTSFNRIWINHYYNGSAVHIVDVQLYNYNTTSWDTHSAYNGAMTGYEFLDIPIIDGVEDHISDGEVKLRLYHETSGNASHVQYVDYIAVVKAGFGATGSDHGSLTGLGDDDHTQYHTDTRGDTRYYTQSQVNTISGVLQTDIDGKLENIIEDTTPQLGGDLDVNGHNITNLTLGNSVTIKTEDNTSGNAGDLFLNAGDGGSGFGAAGETRVIAGDSDGGSGGHVRVWAGNATGAGTGSGGNTYIYAGDGNQSNGGTGGNVLIEGGPAGPTGNGGAVNISAGDPGWTSGIGGSVSISAGDGFEGSGGALTLKSGDATSSTADAPGGNVAIEAGNASGDGDGGVIYIRPGRKNPSGSGDDGWVMIENDTGTTEAPELRLREGATNGADYVSLKAPDSMGAGTSRTWVLPDDDPATADGKYLTTDSSGNLSFAAAATETYVDTVSGVLQTNIDNVDTDLVNDTTPQLGGDLDTNGNDIITSDVSSGSADIITIKAGTSTDADNDAGHVYIETSATAGAIYPGRIRIRTGSSSSSEGTGPIEFYTGAASAGDSGWMSIYTGSAGSTFDVGSLSIVGGNNSGSGKGGIIRLQAGYSTSGADGFVGIVRPNSGSSDAELRLFDGSSESADNYVSLKVASGGVSTSRTWNLPTDDPSTADGKYLTTDSSGNLSFAEVSVGGESVITEAELTATSGVLQNNIDAKADSSHDHDEIKYGANTSFSVYDSGPTKTATLEIDSTDYLYFSPNGDQLRIGTTTDSLTVAPTAGTHTFEVDNSEVGQFSSSGLQLGGSGATISTFSTDTTFSGASDTEVPTKAAVKSYVDANAGGGSGAGSSYVHTQTSASGTWTVNHNLGQKYIVIQVSDDDDEVIIPDSITYTSVNTATITFLSAKSGQAVASIGGASAVTAGAFVHTQTTSGTSWVVNHNLGSQYVNVQVADENDLAIIPDEISFDSTNQLTITFLESESGHAAITSGGVSVTGVQDWTTVSGNTTAANGNRLLVDTTSSSVTITMPPSPSIGNEVEIVDAAINFGTNNCTLDRNGSKIEGVADDYILDVDRADVKLLYASTAAGWRVIS